MKHLFLTDDFLNWDPESLEDYHFSMLASLEDASWNDVRGQEKDMKQMRLQQQAQLVLELTVDGRHHLSE